MKQKQKIWNEWKIEIPDRMWTLEVAGIHMRVFLNDDGTYEVYTEEININSLDEAKLKAQEYLIRDLKETKNKIDKILSRSYGRDEREIKIKGVTYPVIEVQGICLSEDNSDETVTLNINIIGEFNKNELFDLFKTMQNQENLIYRKEIPYEFIIKPITKEK